MQGYLIPSDPSDLSGNSESQKAGRNTVVAALIRRKMLGAGDMINERLLLKELKGVGVFKLGNYTLQSGQNSPIYVDLRLLFTSPRVLVSFFFLNFFPLVL